MLASIHGDVGRLTICRLQGTKFFAGTLALDRRRPDLFNDDVKKMSSHS
jgi:hypothetical protein